jgi:hypothetical protein
VLQICMRVTECFAVGGLAMDPAVRRGVLTRDYRVVRAGPRNDFWEDLIMNDVADLVDLDECQRIVWDDCRSVVTWKYDGLVWMDHQLKM